MRRAASRWNTPIVFWGGRSEIKPSEISPIVFKEWHAKWKDVAGPVV